MKQIRFLYAISCILVFTYHIHNRASIHKHTGFTNENQYNTDRFDIFWKPVKYTQSSIKCFLKHTYNNVCYAQKFLALNFPYHIIPLLSYAQQNESPRLYSKSILDLFEQKSKSTPYINAFSFLEFLELAPKLLADYCIETYAKELYKKQAIKQSLYNFFLNDFNSLKENPEEALDRLAENVQINIKKVRKQQKTEDISIKDFQYTVSQFLEVTLSKLIWSPKDQEAIWQSVKLLSLALEELARNNIITSDNLDKHYWTLICRFTDDFLSIAGAELNQECYEAINKDLANEKLSLWCLEERETYITPKAEYLKRAIVSAEVRSRAFSAGLITDIIPSIG